MLPPRTGTSQQCSNPRLSMVGWGASGLIRRVWGICNGLKSMPSISACINTPVPLSLTSNFIKHTCSPASLHPFPKLLFGVVLCGFFRWWLLLLWSPCCSAMGPSRVLSNPLFAFCILQPKMTCLYLLLSMRARCSYK